MEMDELLNFGIINFDKPAGPTSYSVSEYVRRKLGLTKTSHMGTLDPKVSGVLPITLGRACKLAAYFIRHDKTYVGILHTHTDQKIEDLQKLIDEKFVGKIKQTPPHRSAVKREEREREVYFWNLIEAATSNRDFLFEVKVEGGTYIRKICSDLGEMIGGAHMDELRRTEAGIFSEEKIYSLYDFDLAVEAWKNGDEKILREMVVPATDAIRKVIPCFDVEKKILKGLWTGRPIHEKDFIGKIPKVENGKSFGVFCEEVFVGVYKKTGEGEIFARAEFVKAPF